MNILILGKVPPIQGGVSVDTFWLALSLAEQGHTVTVVTNADEVETEFRIDLEPEAIRLMSAKHAKGRMTILSTRCDSNHVYIPAGNPTFSKLTSLALRHISEQKTDVIYSHYLEPYGVTAMLVSKLTKTPYVVRHAGSDFERLMSTDQLAPIYEQCLRNAEIVMSKKRNWNRMKSIGVESERLREPCSMRLNPHVFFPTEPQDHDENVITVGIYGKTGPAKGTVELIDAIRLLKDRGMNVKVKAAWGGKHYVEAYKRIKECDLESNFDLLGFIPPWEIGDLIRGCDAVLFLENRFRVKSHTPGIPMEVVSCGRPVIVTEEIFRKKAYEGLLVEGMNAFVIHGRLTPDAIADGICLVGGSTNFRDSWLRPMIRPHLVREASLRRIEDVLIAVCQSSLQAASQPHESQGASAAISATCQLSESSTPNAS